MDEVESVEKHENKKKGHFLLSLKDKTKVHLKCDEASEADSWVESIKELSAIYRDKKLVDFDIERKYKDKVDVRVMNLIMKEIEGKRGE
jgi:hypothetical protein